MTCYDAHGNRLESADLTRGYIHPHRQKDGTVIHIYRPWTEEELMDIQAGLNIPSLEEEVARLRKGLVLLLTGKLEEALRLFKEEMTTV